MKLKKIIWPVAIALVLGGGLAWKLSSNKAQMSATAAIANKKTTVFPVITATPTMAVLSQDVLVSGRFDPVHELDLVSETAGRVTAVARRNGDAVQKGQAVIQLDDEQIGIDLELADATMIKAQRDLDNYRELLKTNAVNRQDVLNQELTLKNAQARVATLKRQRTTMKIVSTISGSINNMNIEVGSYLSPGTKIARIADLSQLTMIVKMQANDVINVKRGQKVNVISDLNTTDTITGTVSAIGTIADGSRKYEVEITIANSTRNALYAGMTGNAYFHYPGTRSSMVIPAKCIVGSTLDPKVYVIEDGIANLIPIVTGQKQGEMVEVYSGLRADQVVVESGQVGLTSGSKVKIVNGK